MQVMMSQLFNFVLILASIGAAHITCILSVVGRCKM